jgi:hypothetical protein
MSPFEWFVVLASAGIVGTLPYTVVVWLLCRDIKRIMERSRVNTEAAIARTRAETDATIERMRERTRETLRRMDERAAR